VESVVLRKEEHVLEIELTVEVEVKGWVETWQFPLLDVNTKFLYKVEKALQLFIKG